MSDSRGYVFPHSKVSWGIIGVGDVCEKKAGPALYKASRSSLAAVMRRTKHKAEDFAARHGVPGAYDSVEALLADAAVNAVYIASPVAFHAEHALAVAKAGLPCLLEKPMARCAEEANLIFEAFRDANVPLWVAYYRRCHPAPLHLQRMVSNGDLGEILWVEYDLNYEVAAELESYQQAESSLSSLPWRFNPSISGGGLVLDVGSHVIDLIEFLFGPVNIQSSFASRSKAYGECPVEDLVVFNFSAASVNSSRGAEGSGRADTGIRIKGASHSQLRGTCRWDFGQPKGRGRDELLRIIGTKKMVMMQPLASNGFTISDNGKENEFISLPPSEHVHQNLVQSIVNELLSTRAVHTSTTISECEMAEGVGLLDLPECLSTGSSGLRASTHLDTALQTFYGSRRCGFWDGIKSPP